MITTADVRDAADILRPVFDATGGQDGRVSIEVDPRLAHNTRPPSPRPSSWPGWWTARTPSSRSRPPRRACRRSPRSSAAGISVNVTLIFSLERYREVMDAYLAGLEKAKARGPGPLEDPLGGVLLRVPRGHRDRQAARRARHRRGQGGPRQGRRRQRPPRLPGVRGGLLDRPLERPGEARAPTSSVRCGPRPASRTRRTRTRCTSTTWSRRTRSTPCRRPPWRPPRTTARSPATPSPARTSRPAPSSTRSRSSGSRYDDVVQLLEDEGVEKFEASWNDLLKSTEAELERLAPSEG